MSIQIHHLTKHFGGSAVIDDLSVSFAPGKITVLLGPSGCGKTTTLRCIAGLETPDHGEIRIGDKPVFDSEQSLNLPPEHRDIGMVFQSYAIWPHMTVFENVALPLKARRLPADEVARRVADTLSKVGLAAMAERSATQLSGGQQQRVALARCLASHPKLILLDEPLSNLDAKLRVEMRTEIKDLQRSLGATMLFVTHDQEEALSLADAIFLFDRGRVVQSGAPKDLYYRPANRFAAEFLGKANLIPLRLDTVDGMTEARLRSDTQVLLSRSSATAPEFTDPWAMVRPEAWEIRLGGGDGLAGSVTDISFVGERQLLRVETPFGTQTVSSPGYTPLSIGSPVSLSIAQDQLHVIEQGSPGSSRP